MFHPDTDPVSEHKIQSYLPLCYIRIQLSPQGELNGIAQQVCKRLEQLITVSCDDDLFFFHRGIISEKNIFSSAAGLNLS